MRIRETDMLILKHLAEGKTMKEIGPKVYMSMDGVRDRLRKMRKHYNCKNTIHLIYVVFYKNTHNCDCCKVGISNITYDIAHEQYSPGNLPAGMLLAE